MQLEIIHQTPQEPNGQSLLFVHGMWHGAWCWQVNFLPFFSNLGYDCYALSLRNHGKSDSNKAIWRVRIKDYVEDLRQAVKSIGKNPILAGHSMGGFIVQKYLEKHTAPAVILLASVPPYGIIGPTIKVVKKFPLSFIKANLTIDLKKIIANKAAAKHLLFSSSLSDEKTTLYHAQLQSEAYIGYIEMLGLNLPKTKKITPPKMLVIGAENDRVISPKAIQKTANTYHASVSVIPDIAHDVMLDSNWELVANRMQEWLESSRAGKNS